MKTNKIMFSGMIVVLIMTFVLTGCVKQNTQTPPVVVDGNRATVDINHFIFEPATLEVNTGTTVTWEHNDNVVHTVVSEGLFTSPSLNRGDVFKFTFDKPGEYDYYCSIHPSMRGKILVK